MVSTFAALGLLLVVAAANCGGQGSAGGGTGGFAGSGGAGAGGGAGGGDAPADGFTTSDTPASTDLVGLDAADANTSTGCDGGNGLALAYVRTAALANSEPGSQVVFENGWSFLFVTRACRYFAFTPERGGTWAETRTGQLDADGEARLLRELGRARWPMYRGVHSPGISDASADVLAAPGISVTCAAACTFAAAPAGLPELYRAAEANLLRLHATGTPLRGPVRVAVVALGEVFPVWDHGAAIWPASHPLAPLVIPFMPAEAGTSIEIQGADASALRTLRDEQRAGKYSPPEAGGFIPVRASAGAPLHGLYLRDAIAELEDARGLIARPD